MTQIKVLMCMFGLHKSFDEFNKSFDAFDRSFDAINYFMHLLNRSMNLINHMMHSINHLIHSHLMKPKLCPRGSWTNHIRCPVLASA